jgi:hypothetical protein
MFSWILSDTLRSFWTATLGLVQNLLRASRSQDRPTIKMFWIGQSDFCPIYEKVRVIHENMRAVRKRSIFYD